MIPESVFNAKENKKMKKVIKGRVYCTETAKYLGNWSNTANSRDFAWTSETLYRTKSGQYFLHCEGGPLSRYGYSCGNQGGYDEHIEVLSIDQAKQWAEENLNGDEYIKAFGTPDEEARPTISISAESKLKLDEMQSRSGKQQIQIVEELILKAYKEGIYNA